MHPTRTTLRIVAAAAAFSAPAVAGALGFWAPPQQQQPRPADSSAGVPTLTVPGTIDWIQRASVAARHEGIVEQVEKTIGMDVRAGEAIALLDDTLARLSAEKAAMVSEDRTAVEMALAEKELANANLARAWRLKNGRVRDVISDEEYEIKQAQFKVADVRVAQEEEKLSQATKELELAERIVRDHVVTAPFDGEIIEVLKQPGESVQAMESVVQLARTDRVRFNGWVPIEAAHQLQKGMVVDVTPVVEGAELPIEQKRFRGRVVFIGPELVGSNRRTEVQVKADIINNAGMELRVGHRADMTVYLTDDPAQIPPNPEDMLQLEQPAAATARNDAPAAAPAQ